MASYAGYDLGLIFEMQAIPAPKARQLNAYPGADGLESIDLGSRGGATIVLGAFGANSSSGLSLLLQMMRSFHDAGTANVLVDEFGVAFAGVILEQFAPIGRVYPGGAGDFYQQYQAQFLHLL